MSVPEDPHVNPQPNLPGGPREVIAPDSVGERPMGAATEPTASDAAPQAAPQIQPGQGEIESPAKIIRIGAMIKQMLEEVRNTSIDDAARDQLRRIHDSAVAELKEAMSEDLGEELDSLAFDFSGDEPPTEAELRMSQAQLVGWLEGLFHGIQATLVAQQMAARQQLEGMRAQLPERPGPPGHGPGYI